MKKPLTNGLPLQCAVVSNLTAGVATSEKVVKGRDSTDCLAGSGLDIARLHFNVLGLSGLKLNSL